MMGKNVFQNLGLFALVGVLFLGGQPGKAENDTYDKLDIFAQVLHFVQNGYVEEVESKKLLYGAIRGMLSVLDPHSSFMTPEEFRSMQEDTSGRFGGVGVEIEVREGMIIVIAPVDDTPASRAGILPGDRIVKIDGKPTEKMDVPEASRHIKGVPGTKVVLTIDRDDFDQPKDYVLIRQLIRANPVEKSMPVTGYGLVKIRSFQERTERHLAEALEELKKEAGGELMGLVLDLRNNPGGLLDQAVRVADRFIEEGVIVETQGRGQKTEKDFAHKQGTEPFYPLICLINGGSASASEIVAGALQDHNRALIMGTRSFGKGSVQTVIGLKDGSGLKLTIARYFTPNHRSIQEKGIDPDVEVPSKKPERIDSVQIIREENLERHLKKEDSSTDFSTQIDKIQDYQLQTALFYLKAWDRFGRSKLSPSQSTPNKKP